MKFKLWILSALGASCAWCAELSVSVVDPTSAVPVLPQSKIENSLPRDFISIVMAPGETRGASFVVNSPVAYRDFLVEAQNLKGSGNAVIPAESLDIKVVKCWYQGATAWWGIQGNPALKSSERVLVPELMLHDERLVKVDHDTRKNYLRLAKSTGDEYVDISDDSTLYKTGQGDWPRSNYPVYDAPRLLPIELPAAENRQYVVTYHAPANLKHGVYQGKFDFTAAGGVVGSIKVQIEILPFALAEARTKYDLDRKFVVSIYYNSMTGVEPREGNLHAYRRNDQQIMAEMENMAAHGITNPDTVQSLQGVDFFDERNRTAWHKLLAMRKKVGFDNSEIFYCSNPYLNLGFNKAYRGTTPEEIDQFIQRAKKVMEWIRSGTGEDTQVYFYGLDEAEGEKLENQKKAFHALHEAGGKVWVSGYKASKERPGNFALVGKELDLFNAAFYPEKAEAAKWHSQGKRILCYSNPQSGPENPDMQRRNYGLALYLRDYDGICNFKYNSLFGDGWNDFDHASWRDHAYVYNTQDGVIDTIAWEGFREAVNDIRYATTLQLAIREALANGSDEKKEIAAAANEWFRQLRVKDYIFNSTDKWIEKTPNLETIRLEMIQWILKLSPITQTELPNTNKEMGEPGK